MSKRELKQFFREVLDENMSCGFDFKEDKNKLINELADQFWVNDYDDVVRIGRLIFPNSQVDETFMGCELIIKTALYNVAAAGDRPILVDAVDAVSREISSND